MSPLTGVRTTRGPMNCCPSQPTLGPPPTSTVVFRVDCLSSMFRPGTGSGGWNSISSCQWPSARADCGMVSAAARAATARTASQVFGVLRYLVYCLVLSFSSRLRRLPSQPWGRRGLRPLRRSPSFRFFLFSLGRLRRPRLARRAISLSGPGPLCACAGGSLRTSWAGGPA